MLRIKAWRRPCLRNFRLAAYGILPRSLANFFMFIMRSGSSGWEGSDRFVHGVEYPSTTIRYGLPVRSHVTVSVFNTLGQEVATVVQREEEAGYHEVRFDGSNLASGVYINRMSTRGYTSTRKLLLAR